MVNEEYYQYPTGIVYRTENVVDLYLDFPDMDSFYDYYGTITPTTINNIKNEYNIDQSVDVNIYVGGEQAPVSGTSVFQKIISQPSVSSGDTALDAAAAAATAGLINGFNGIVSGNSDIYSLVSTLVDGGAGYGLAGLLAIDVEAAICAVVAALGYKIGTDVYNNLNEYQWFKELIELGEDWVANDDSKLANLYRKVLGVQYENNTYLDSRLVEAVLNKLNEYITSIIDPNSQLIDPAIIEQMESGGFSYFPVSKVAANEIIYCRGKRGSNNYYIISNKCSTDVTYMVFYDNDSNIPGYFVVPASNQPFSFLTGSATNNGSYPSLPTPSTSRIVDSYTKNGKTVYYGTGGGMGAGSYGSITFEGLPITTNRFPVPSGFSYGEVIWELYYSVDIQFPDELEPAPWHYPVDPSINKIDILVDLTNEVTVPFYPIALPTAPYVYPQYPVDYPDITIIQNPDDQIIPYHIPAPVQPETNPESDPDDNPSNPAPVIIPIVLPIGGGGSNGGQSPSIPIPTVFPPFFDGVSQYGGLYTVYAPTQQQLYDFGDFLWVKWTDASLPKIINNPFDGVISLHEIYATPGITGSKEITSGFLKSNVTAATVGDRYTEIDCGTVIVPENYQNYLDYSPYSKVYCFLPFIGLVQLNSDDIVGHAVNITYKVDSYSGACVAIITVAQSNGDDENYSVAMYQFEGNCAVQLPISGGSQASLTAGLWLAGSSAVGSIVNGVASMVGSHNVMNLLEGVSGAISDVSATLLTRKSDVQHSGNMAGNFGAMAGKKPYLIVKFPRQVPAPNYNMDYGYPAHRRVTIGQCTGYLRVREVNIISATATDDEKAKIEQLLKEGVYFE